jgi:hypothetical protein
MPTESQALYFHLGMRADDDGVVEAYPILKMMGFAPDVIKVLLAKGFLQQLNEDQVCFIIDWDEHNVIRADRKVNSIYKPLLDQIGIKTLEPKPRSDVEDNSKRLLNEGCQSVDGPRSVQGRHRLGEVSTSTSTKNSKSLRVSSTNDEKSLKDDITDIDISNELKGATPPTPTQEIKKLVLEPTPREETIQFFNTVTGKGESLWVAIYLEQLAMKGYPRDQLRKEAIRFVSYWTEKNGNGKKERWELQKTFEVKRRLITWLSRQNSIGQGFVKKTKTIIYE